MPKQLTHKTRAIRKLESLDWIVDDVERRIPHTRITRDLFGLFDLVAVKGRTTLGLQVTVPDRLADHVYKMLGEEHKERLAIVLGAGWLCECWGVRNESTRDGSFAIMRSFELDKRGEVLLFDGSDVL